MLFRNIAGFFLSLKSNELLFNLAVLISTGLNYFLLVLINKSTDASNYYLALALATSLISFFSLGFSKAVLRYFSISVVKRALYAVTISCVISSLVLLNIFDRKFALIPIIGLVDLLLIVLRKKGVAFDFFIVKLSLPLVAIGLILFLEQNILVAIYSSYAVTICLFLVTSARNFSLNLEPNNISIKAQARYSWPLSINETLRIAASYADQIVLGALVSLTDLTGYTLFIRFGIGMRTFLTIPQVRLLPFILKERQRPLERFKELRKKYFIYTLVIAILFFIFRDLLLETFSISVEDYTGYFYLLLIAEVIRSMSGYLRLSFAIGEKTKLNLYSNIVHTMVILMLFFPMYRILGILGLILAQLIGSVIQLFFDIYLMKRYV